MFIATLIKGDMIQAQTATVIAESESLTGLVYLILKTDAYHDLREPYTTLQIHWKE